MPTFDDDPAVAHWPKMPRMVNEAGKQLQPIYGDSGIPARELRRLAEKMGEYKAGSVLPSDYCYNMVNRATFSFLYCILVRVSNGRYKYVGPNYAYTGLVLWKPKGGQERTVGQWQAGVYVLTEDPRA